MFPMRFLKSKIRIENAEGEHTNFADFGNGSFGSRWSFLEWNEVWIGGGFGFGIWYENPTLVGIWENTSIIFICHLFYDSQIRNLWIGGKVFYTPTFFPIPTLPKTNLFIFLSTLGSAPRPLDTTSIMLFFPAWCSRASRSSSSVSRRIPERKWLSGSLCSSPSLSSCWLSPRKCQRPPSQSHSSVRKDISKTSLDSDRCVSVNVRSQGYILH